ncbi:16S rRNA (guanine1516-N2)-methyltransferase [Tamilnaduibacter salinus]|uniref:Ribosomal RNA small subunit methyltransferase J n=1 Tax=Tamilnaduibacter salinus TaxID=1484056 RepID=A0A2U1D0U6_9GAMM|nr:class I SAM-dependent methyltransferase [Tamilnaduibacter salinus]PVY78999.1 16S rRNA (guanine1516-N2)-methyltransferase [Tamilnaduibacter salinus]
MITSGGPSLAIAALDDAGLARARDVSSALSLPLLHEPAIPRHETDYALLLLVTDQGLGLQVTGRKAPGPVRCEFVRGKAGYRRDHGGGTGQLVAKAVGLKKTRRTLHVLDATAGLGEDAYVLAGLGCRLTLMERSPIVRALLEDGLGRAAEDPGAGPVVARMTVRPGDSIRWLEEQHEPVADVIYLDPMFPETGKAAKAKKEMALFRELVGNDDDAPALLAAALDVARYRVVVKRPRLAPPIDGPVPDLQLTGKSSRFDVYTHQKLPEGPAE